MSLVVYSRLDDTSSVISDMLVLGNVDMRKMQRRALFADSTGR